MSYLTGRGASSKDSTREAIVNLREHLLMLDKKEEHLSKKIEDELRKAKANATTNPRGETPCTAAAAQPRREGRQLVDKRAHLSFCTPTVAKQALRQKKLYENELDSISGRKMTLTTQVSRRFARAASCFNLACSRWNLSVQYG